MYPNDLSSSSAIANYKHRRSRQKVQSRLPQGILCFNIIFYHYYCISDPIKLFLLTKYIQYPKMNYSYDNNNIKEGVKDS